MNMFKLRLDSASVESYARFEHVQLNPNWRLFMHEPMVITYGVYVLISVVLTIWVARTLHKRGAIFLSDAFHGNQELAASVNHLLVVGFYLINIGFVALALRSNAQAVTAREAIETLSDKLGYVLLTLGAMHFFNLFVFSRIRSHGQNRVPRRPVIAPPVAPDAVLQVAVAPSPISAR